MRVMSGTIQPGAIAFARSVWPNGDISGEGGPFAVLRFPYERRPSVVFFPTKSEALDAGVKTGDRVILCATPVPRIPKSKELGYRDRDDERWERRMKVDGL